MKKYFFGTKNVLLLIASLINAIFTVFLLLLYPISSDVFIAEIAIEIFQMLFTNPLSYLGILAIITIFSRDVKHCIILNIFQFVSTFLLISLSSDSADYSYDLLLIVGIILMIVFLLMHTASVLIKFFVMRNKKKNSIQK